MCRASPAAHPGGVRETPCTSTRRTWPARLLFGLLLMVIPGSQILIYPVLWILMPSEETVGFQPPEAPPVPA